MEMSHSYFPITQWLSFCNLKKCAISFAINAIPLKSVFVRKSDFAIAIEYNKISIEKSFGRAVTYQMVDRL